MAKFYVLQAKQINVPNKVVKLKPILFSNIPPMAVPMIDAKFEIRLKK